MNDQKERRKREEVRKVEKEEGITENGKRQSKRWNERWENRDVEMERNGVETVTY